MPTNIYRITHYRNIPFILQNGLWCCNCVNHDPGYINIGHLKLISSRGERIVPLNPGGVLNDYVPFYFTKRSPMLYLIHRGNVPDYTGTQEEIVYIVSSFEKIQEDGLPFVFTDKHAKLQYANFYNTENELTKIDWSIINDTSWSNTADDNTRQDKKQAELLIHNHVPVNCFIGIACQTESITNLVQNFVQDAGMSFPVATRLSWYY